jgi:uncharacterized iron-regulated membrane protein
MANLALRKLHRKIAPYIFVPLVITGLTGILFSISINWLGMEEKTVKFFLDIHQGTYLGNQLRPIYILLLGLGLLGAIVSGVSMIKLKLFGSDRPDRANTKLDVRTIHRLLAPIFFLPLTVSALTGISYRLGRSWLGMEKKQAEIFLEIHQGEYFGDFFSTYLCAFSWFGTNRNGGNGNKHDWHIS